MQACVLEKIKAPLVLKNLPEPVPQENELLLEVSCCALCRTDLHIIDGELPSPKLPLILGHQIVGRVVSHGKNVTHFKKGDRVGVPWLQGSCKVCRFCKSGRENLCDFAIFTGYRKDGGLAEYCVAHADFCFPLPSSYNDQEAAPLLCGGLIGYRAYKMAKEAKRLGFFGFGSSAHILTQIARKEGRDVYAFTHHKDSESARLAKELGAVWVGTSEDTPPEKLDAAILFAPVGALIPQALKHLDKGGTVISAGIHMSDIPSFPYSLLWEERIIRSVANLTRQDGIDFFSLANEIPLQTKVNLYPLEKVNEAFQDLRNGRFSGSYVVNQANLRERK